MKNDAANLLIYSELHNIVYIMQYCGKKTIQNNFTWYLQFYVGGPTIFQPGVVGPPAWNIKYQVKLFCIVFFPHCYNTLMLSTL